MQPYYAPLSRNQSGAQGGLQMTDYIEAVAALFESGELLEALPKERGAYDW